MKVIGQKIRKIREWRDLKQTDVAQQLGISVRQYENIEHGDSSLSVLRLVELARIFKVNVNQILDEDIKQVFNNHHQQGDFIANNYSPNELVKHLIAENGDLKTELALLKNKP